MSIIGNWFVTASLSAQITQFWVKTKLIADRLNVNRFKLKTFSFELCRKSFQSRQCRGGTFSRIVMHFLCVSSNVPLRIKFVWIESTWCESCLNVIRISCSSVHRQPSSRFTSKLLRSVRAANKFFTKGSSTYTVRLLAPVITACHLTATFVARFSRSPDDLVLSF